MHRPVCQWVSCFLSELCFVDFFLLISGTKSCSFTVIHPDHFDLTLCLQYCCWGFCSCQTDNFRWWWWYTRMSSVCCLHFTVTLVGWLLASALPMSWHHDYSLFVLKVLLNTIQTAFVPWQMRALHSLLYCHYVDADESGHFCCAMKGSFIQWCLRCKFWTVRCPKEAKNAKCISGHLYCAMLNCYWKLHQLLIPVAEEMINSYCYVHCSFESYSRL